MVDFVTDAFALNLFFLPDSRKQASGKNRGWRHIIGKLFYSNLVSRFGRSKRVAEISADAGTSPEAFLSVTGCFDLFRMRWWFIGCILGDFILKWGLLDKFSDRKISPPLIGHSRKTRKKHEQNFSARIWSHFKKKALSREIHVGLRDLS